MEIDVGQAIGGKYELVRLLGRGSMGEVWLAHHRTLGENVAVKLLTQSSAAQPQRDGLEDGATAAARFRFEAQVAARLSRKTRHIVRVTDHGEEEGLPYLVMELLEGETLEALLAREGPLPLEVVTALASQIGRALGQAHAEGVFHRDLKPANVFLARDEEGKLLAKLLDFGIARAIHVHRHPHRAGPSAFATGKGVIFGTPSYMSPEQARGSSKLDHRCDLWALAAIVYESLTGETPIEGTDTDQVMQNLCAGRTRPRRIGSQGNPDALDPFFERAFAEEITLRFQTAAELGEALEAASAPVERDEAPTPPSDEDAEPVESTPGSVLDRHMGNSAARTRGRVRAAILAGVALLGVLAFAGLAWRSKPPAAALAPVVPSASETGKAAPSDVAPVAVAPPPSASDPAPGSRPVPVSALPHAKTVQPVPAPARTSGTNATNATNATSHNPRAVGRPPDSLPAAPATAPPPAPAPAPSAQKGFDKSEVF
jgi:serine/threonine-protein kinase